MSNTISIVVPCFNEAEVLPLLYERLTHLPRLDGTEFEIVLVDDGSTDSTWQQLKAFAEFRTNWKAVRLARNFGHQKALWTGLSHVSGDAVFVIDADLQDPPELVEAFLEEWRSGSDVVYGVRRKRKEGFIKRLAYASFYRILSMVADIEIPLDAGDFCLMDRKVVEAMLQGHQVDPFVRGARAWVGFRQTAFEYERDSRAAGVEKYGLKKLFQLAFNGLFSYSSKPLQAIFWSGAMITVLAFCWMLTAICGFALGSGLWGLNGFFVATVSIVGLLGGMQMMALGIVAAYVGRIFEGVSRRPTAIVSEISGAAKELPGLKISRPEEEHVAEYGIPQIPPVRKAA